MHAGTAGTGRPGGRTGFVFANLLCEHGNPADFEECNRVYETRKKWPDQLGFVQAGEDLAYYLESLNNWNQAVIHSYELGKSHTTQYLIEQWKEVIVNIENGTGAAAGGGGF